MKNSIKSHILISLTLMFVLSSCSCVNHNNSSLPTKSKSVNVKVASDRVSQASNLSIRASEKLIFAQSELEKARKETEEAKSLVAQMKKNRSPFADMVAALRDRHETLVNKLTEQLNQTGTLLEEQFSKLNDARIDLNKAREASAASEAEKATLRSHVIEADKKLTKSKQELKDLEVWKAKNIWYKKFFWWTISTVVVLGGAWLYFTGATGGLARFIRR
jgi:chromosome segregation ATPase